MTITQINHINDEAQQNTDQNHSHWSHHMVGTSLDYCQDSHFFTFITGGLNMQGLHHCVPGLSASRYREFYPTYRRVCEKHGLKIIEASSFSKALACYWGHITKLSDEKY
jgi:fatty acid desaturase